jgi:hypothetical protein
MVFGVLIATLLLPNYASPAQAAPGQQDSPVETVRAAAVGTTYTVTSTGCTGPGSFVEAVELANANPGPDTISFTPGLQIDADDILCPPIAIPDRTDYFIAQVTDSVTIEGNGARFKGRISWVSTTGRINPLNACPREQFSNDIITAETPGFLKVGVYGTSNAGLTVVVKDLELFQFNAIARVEQEASLELEDFTAKEILSIRDCKRPAIEAREDANVTLRRNHWKVIRSWPLGGPLGETAAFPAVPFGPSISGFWAGDLNIEDSHFENGNLWLPKGKEDGFIAWLGASGSEINVVSSVMSQMKAIAVSGEARTKIVNSVFALESSPDPSVHQERIYNESTQDMDIIASTLLFPAARARLY